MNNEDKETCPRLAGLIEERVRPILHAGKQRVTVIGIDGPTAAGKTILADGLASLVRADGRECWLFRLDWTLAAREHRVADLAHLKQAEAGFPFEAELHMRLEVLSSFLDNVAEYNDTIERGNSGRKHEIKLDGLYSRSDGGTCTGSDVCDLQPGLVIIVEGHYSLRSDLDQLIDYNIVLLAKSEELIRRKIARVEGYRGAAEAEDYFWRIDLPSFHHHLVRFGGNADLVVDNDDYKNPTLESQAHLARWMAENLPTHFAVTDKGPFDLETIIDRVFSVSSMVDHDLRAASQSALLALFDWDASIGAYMRLSIDAIETDLLQSATEAVERLNAEFAERGCTFALGHTNAFHNVFHRNLPVSVGMQVSKDGDKVNVLADVLHDHLLVQVTSRTGYRRFKIDRELGAVSSQSETKIFDVTPESPINAAGPLRVMTPTGFTLPAFLNEIDFEPVYTGREDENISASQALCRLFDNTGVWIHRFPKFSEIEFFDEILRDSGANTVRAGNYLIALWARDDRLRAQFEQFRVGWALRISDQSQRVEDEHRHDRILDAERDALRQFVADNCPDFRYLDGHLFCAKLTSGGATWVRVVSQLSAMLSHPMRIVRKRATQFILDNFPNLTLSVTNLWDGVPHNARKHISLDTFTTISPTILAEVYLWLALREDRSAVLGANIYDIRPNSLDCRAHIHAASEKGTPIVIQSSLNALGQTEVDGETEVSGYLRPRDGAKDLADAVMTSARDMVLLDDKVPPLFGVGLDHVDARNDRPKGRAKRFMRAALDTGEVTHVVLDGSALFDAKDHTDEALEQAFDTVTDFAVDLLDGDEHLYIYDQEICAGELNYVGTETQAMIPTPAEMQVFARTYRAKIRDAELGAINTRPTLFIGNLGTTHHNFDTGDVTVEAAKDWCDVLKRDNFVSAVLHGTTSSHPDLLARATLGCHKINVAGDFLRTLVQGLSEPLRQRVENTDKEPKTMLADIRDDMNDMPAKDQAQLFASLKAHSRSVLDTVNSPRLEPMDVEYFRYKQFKFSKRHIDVIVDALIEWRVTKPVSGTGIAADPSRGTAFSASMIEVPFDDEYRKMAQMLWDQGTRDFHIDAGDGKFITRQIDGLEKARYLKDTFPDVELHAHLMIEAPHIAQGDDPSSIEAYIDAGCDAVAVHERAFSSNAEFLECLAFIRQRGARPGIIIETSQSIDERLWTMMKKADINWAVVMGVPVGYGGQIFDMNTLNRISALYNYARGDDYPFLIEVDGGLNMETLKLCRDAGAQMFAGWSIIRDDNLAGIEAKLLKIQQLLERR